MHFCKNCFRSKIFYRVDKIFEKCVAYILYDYVYYLFIFSTIIRCIHNEKKKRIRKKIRKIRVFLHEQIIVLQKQTLIVQYLKRKFEILKK